MERQGFGIRFGAMILDFVILLVALAIVGFVLGVGPMVVMRSAEAGAAVTTTAVIVMALIPLLYSSIEIFKAASPGKMILHLIIRNADGTPASSGTLAVRWLVKYSSQIPSLLAVLTTVAMLNTLAGIAGLIVFIGCFMVFGQARQALHDLAGKTAVYKVS